jgi:transcriptional regulator with XRE-family HTH domain
MGGRHRITRPARAYRSLRDWRRAAGLKQAEAAQILGVTQSHYSKLERRVTGTVGARAVAIMQRTGVPIEVLLIAEP